MSDQFKGKVDVVTGGSSGIGRATVELLVTKGCQVMVGDLHEPAGQAMVEALGPDHVAFRRCDVAYFDEVQALMEAAVSVFGGAGYFGQQRGHGLRNLHQC